MMRHPSAVGAGSGVLTARRSKAFAFVNPTAVTFFVFVESITVMEFIVGCDCVARHPR
jgi:hypothetical protein